MADWYVTYNIFDLPITRFCQSNVWNGSLRDVFFICLSNAELSNWFERFRSNHVQLFNRCNNICRYNTAFYPAAMQIGGRLCSILFVLSVESRICSSCYSEAVTTEA